MGYWSNRRTYERRLRAKENLSAEEYLEIVKSLRDWVGGVLVSKRSLEPVIEAGTPLGAGFKQWYRAYAWDPCEITVKGVMDCVRSLGEMQYVRRGWGVKEKFWVIDGTPTRSSEERYVIENGNLVSLKDECKHYYSNVVDFLLEYMEGLPITSEMVLAVRDTGKKPENLLENFLAHASPQPFSTMTTRNLGPCLSKLEKGTLTGGDTRFQKRPRHEAYGEYNEWYATSWGEELTGDPDSPRCVRPMRY